LGHIYSLAYRFDSQSAVHPSHLAIEQYLERRPERITVLATPSGPRPDPYVTGTALLLIVMTAAGAFFDHSLIDAGLTEIQTEVASLGFA
jgi:hypothetical protein